MNEIIQESPKTYMRGRVGYTLSDYNNVGIMHHTYIDDDKVDVHNNSNLHSEEQNDLEIPEALQQTLNSSTQKFNNL
ncbi:hypothetical protein C1645_827236 [Glomus cerebriforme]|uniref:Uncharacterized protein n=1 Tax=Glomus cerebriforme TaxID=658196 RepID=A0A397SYH6_9GLOM|nr:hypothetical protein C1645_827236 [Glomus cerebriforme]